MPRQGRWLSDDVWEESDGRLFDASGRLIGGRGGARPPPPGHAYSNPPQQHFHQHQDTLHRTQSAQPTYDMPGGRRRRSRSRSHSREHGEEFYRNKFEREARERDELLARAAADQRHEDEEREREAERLVEDAKLKERLKREEDEKKRKQLIAEARQKEKDDEEKRERLIHEAELERKEKERKRKEERERIIREAELEKEEEKKKEEEEFKKWELKKKEKELKEKDEKDKKDQEYLERVQRDMAKFGMSPRYVENMIKYEEKENKHRFEENSRRRHRKEKGVVEVNQSPVYPKIHRDDIETETLEHYGIKWEKAPDDRSYIILLEELSVEDTDILFDHTKKVRKERKRRRNSALPLLDAPKEPQYAFVRRRSRTRGESDAKEGRHERSHSRVRDKSPMRERLAEKIIRFS